MKQQNHHNPEGRVRIRFSERRLKNLIRQHGMAVSEFQVRLAEACRDEKMKPSTALVYGWLRGQSDPASVYLPYIAAVFNVRIDDLFELGGA